MTYFHRFKVAFFIPFQKEVPSVRNAGSSNSQFLILADENLDQPKWPSAYTQGR